MLRFLIQSVTTRLTVGLRGVFQFADGQFAPCLVERTGDFPFTHALVFGFRNRIFAQRKTVINGRRRGFVRHRAGKFAVAIVGWQIQLPARVLHWHVERGRSERDRPSHSRKRFRAHVNQFDGNRRIIGAFDGQYQLAVPQARSHRLSGHKRRPDLRAFWQRDFEELPPVVADRKRQSGHHLAVVGHDGCQPRVVHERLQHFGLGKTPRPEHELVAGPQVAINQHGGFIRAPGPVRQLLRVRPDKLGAGRSRRDL